MPRKSKFAKSKRLPVRRRRRFKKGAVNLITRFPSTGLPSSVVMKHRYTEAFNTSTTTTAFSNVFRLNSLYDSDLTGVGHQSFYRDQMATLYQTYTVYGCKVVVRATSGSNQAIVGFVGQQDSASTTNALLQTERPMTKYSMINAGGPVVVMSKYFDIARSFGVTRNNLMAEEDFSGVGNANPAREWYLDVFGQHPDGASSCTFQLVVELTYYVRWSDRIKQNQS